MKEEGHRAFKRASKSLVLEKNREATGITETEAEAVRNWGLAYVGSPLPGVKPDH